MPLSVQVVTPTRQVVVAEDVTFVLAHGVEGDVGILPGHAPLMIALGIGPLELEREGRRERMVVDGGFLQIKDDKVIVLAEYAVLPGDAEAAQVSAQVEELRRRLREDAEDESLRQQLLRAEALQKLIQVG